MPNKVAAGIKVRRAWRRNVVFSEPVTNLGFLLCKMMSFHGKNVPSKIVYCSRRGGYLPAISIRDLRDKILRSQALGWGATAFIALAGALALAYSGFVGSPQRVALEWYAWASFLLIFSAFFAFRSYCACNQKMFRHILDDARFRSWLIAYGSLQVSAIVSVLVVVGSVVFWIGEAAGFLSEDVYYWVGIWSGANFIEFIVALFAHPFLHIGVIHLIGNILLLLIAGFMLESFFQAKMTVWAMVGGGFAGALMSWSFGSPVPTIGSSGVISGVIGALGMMTLLNWRRLPILISMTYALFLLLYVIYGWVIDSVDQVLHLGGLVGGMVVMVCFGRRCLSR
jgi:membrane associated rhomboid family serine protease